MWFSQEVIGYKRRPFNVSRVLVRIPLCPVKLHRHGQVKHKPTNAAVLHYLVVLFPLGIPADRKLSHEGARNNRKEVANVHGHDCQHEQVRKSSNDKHDRCSWYVDGQPEWDCSSSMRTDNFHTFFHALSGDQGDSLGIRVGINFASLCGLAFDDHKSSISCFGVPLLFEDRFKRNKASHY